MNHHDTQAAQAFEGAEVHTLTGSSAPGAATVAFEPIIIGADGELIALAAEVERCADEDNAAYKNYPDDLPSEDPVVVAYEENLQRLGLRLKAASERLAPVPATTTAGLAAKARAFLKVQDWDHFAPKRYEMDLTLSIAKDAASLPPTEQLLPDRQSDAELIAQGRIVEELSDRENAHFGREPPTEGPERDQWSKETAFITEEFRAGIERLAGMRATTSAGLAAKASATLKMYAMFESINWSQEEALVRGLAEDAVRLGAVPLRVAHPVDVPLEAAWAAFQRLQPLVDQAYKEVERLEAECEKRKPARPDAMAIRHDDFPKDAIRFATKETVYDPVQYYSARAIECMRLVPRKLHEVSWDIDTGERTVTGPHIDLVAQARAEEIVAAYDEWRTRCLAVEDEVGLTAADHTSRELADQICQVGDSIRDLDARSVRGIGIKAAWALTFGTKIEEEQDKVLKQIVRFAERCAAPVITGERQGRPSGKFTGMIERWVKVGLMIDEAERCDCGQNSETLELRDEMRVLRGEIASWPTSTFRELLLKALLFNTGEVLRSKVEADGQANVLGTDQLARSIALDVVEMVGIAPHEWPFIGSLPQERPSVEALEAYRTWLSNEFRSLTAEMYPDRPEMTGAIAANNAGDKFHFRGERPASTRAERMLTILGIDWTLDRPSVFADQQAAA